MRFHLTLSSANVKTGPIPVSTSTKATCPPSCPFRGAGCYAEGGPIALHWEIVTRGDRGTDWGGFLESIGRIPRGFLWRHNQAGDLPGRGDRIDAGQLAELVKTQKGRRGFTYTHKPVIAEDCTAPHLSPGEREILAEGNREAIKSANRDGFVVNISANNLAHADRVADLGIAPVVVVVPAGAPRRQETPQGRPVVTCPATYREGTTCASCQLCAKSRGAIIAFPAHGSHRRMAGMVAAQSTINHNKPTN